jgi:hypothetical protein
MQHMMQGWSIMMMVEMMLTWPMVQQMQGWSAVVQTLMTWPMLQQMQGWSLIVATMLTWPMLQEQHNKDMRQSEQYKGEEEGETKTCSPYTRMQKQSTNQTNKYQV